MVTTEYRMSIGTQYPPQIYRWRNGTTEAGEYINDVALYNRTTDQWIEDTDEDRFDIFWGYTTGYRVIAAPKNHAELVEIGQLGWAAQRFHRQLKQTKKFTPTGLPLSGEPDYPTIPYTVDPDKTKGPMLYGNSTPVPRYWWTEDILDIAASPGPSQEEIYIDSLRAGLPRVPSLEAELDMRKIPKGLLEK